MKLLLIIILSLLSVTFAVNNKNPSVPLRVDKYDIETSLRNLPLYEDRLLEYGDDDESTAIIDELVDRILTNVDIFAKSHNLDPITLEGFDDNFLLARVTLSNGTLGGVSTILRNGDVTVSYGKSKHILDLKIPIKFDSINFFKNLQETPSEWKKMEDVKDAQARINKKSKNPFQNAGIVSKFFFVWAFPLFYKGYRHGLDENDMFLHLRSHDSEVQGNKLEREWKKEISKNTNNPSLWKALLRVYSKELMLLGIVNLISDIFRILLPLTLDQFLNYYEPNSAMTINEAYLYAGLVSLTTLAQVVITHHFMFYILHLGQKIRSATSSLVYRKSIRLSKSALAETTIGQMVNLISNDVARFELCTVNVHSLWLGPIELIIVLILLYYYVGFTGLSGAALLLCFIPFQMWMGKKTSLYRLRTAIRTDERIRLMNEIITGMQVIKMYTWEKPFAKLVKLIRLNEIKEIGKNLRIRGIMMAFNVFFTRAVIALCVLTYVLTGNTLNAKYVYVVSLFFEILRQSINQGFTLGVTQFAEANISVRRIKEFLLFDELESQPHSVKSIELLSDKSKKSLYQNGDTNNEPIGVKLSNVSVKWIKSDKEYAMKNIEFRVVTGELVTVIGKVGSGKSTLLHIILRELPPLTGSVFVNGRISYASQEAWLFMGTVKQNILFGQEYDQVRYKKVIEVCGLERDFNLFPHGDRTLVGERGISLSGGQKARINLARAIYKEADIYLLDDPLSAVDTYVGKHIFEECIMGYLKDKCVVLVTHQLQYLKDCKKIYLLKDGFVDFCGTYNEIENAGKEFTNLIKEFKEKMKEAKKDAKAEASNLQEKELNQEKSNDDGEDAIVEKEGKIEGKVTWAVYTYYFLAGGHWCKILALFLMFVISQALASGTDYFLTIWVNVEQLRIEQNTISNSSHESNGLMQDFWLDVLNKDTSVITYGSLVLTVVLLLTVRSLLFFKFCLKSSIKLHDGMFDRIVHTAMRFFNINPSGRILNRFSKDVNQVDEYLPVVFSETLQIGLMGAAITIVVATLTPYILLPTAIILGIFYLLRIVFIATTRDIKRFEAITRSPVYSHLTASLQGLTTIRAFDAQELLREEFDNLQNAYNSAYFMFLSANRTFGYWLDMQSVVFVTLVSYSFLLLSNETLGGNVGLAITQAITLTGLFQFGIRQWSEMENTMTCVERIKEYSEIIPEKNSQLKALPNNWPDKGHIKFESLCLRYALDLPYILKNLTFNIEANEKVGIVGRTGAGKTSMIAALFRLVEIEGTVLIDNVDTKTVPLEILRSNISIIPQEPVLFSGTMKKNLDPFDEYNDEVLWNALEEVKLKQAVSDLHLGLESKMSEGGSNFSVGQRQLVCLARAIIRNNKILVLDEATANIDPYTDGLIQSTIRKKFANCTVLTIAHRLHTIMDSDKVVVMDAGQIVEFGKPYELLQNNSGVFYGMVQQTGRAMADNLISIAKNASKIS